MAVDDRAEHQSAQHDGERPADDRTALQPQTQAREGSRPAGGAEAGPALGTSPPESRRASMRRQREQTGGQEQHEAERPPPVGAPWLHLLAPSDR